MDIRKALLQAQATSGWTQMDIAYNAGVTNQAVSNWLHRRCTPNAVTLELLRVRLPGLAEILDAQAREHVANMGLRNAA